MKSTACVDSFAGPLEIDVAQGVTVCAPASSSLVWSAPLVKLGASLTGLTVIVNVCFLVSTAPFAVPPLSLTQTVMIAVPDWFAAGVNVSEPVAFGLVYVTPGVGISVGFDDV